MSGNFHCWFCKEELDEQDEKCPKCGDGTVCSACGKCICDYHGKSGTGAAANAPSPREIFQKLIDRAEEVQFEQEIDTDPVEMDIMACAIQESGFLGATAPGTIVAALAPSDFQNTKLRKIAETVFPLVKANRVLGGNVVRKLFRDADVRGFAVELLGRPYDAAALPTCIDVVREQARINEAITSLAPSASKLLGGKADVPEIVDSLGGARSQLINAARQSLEIRSERDELLHFAHDLEQRQQEADITGLRSGFPHLDNVLNGICPGVSGLAGPPSSGKTTFCVQLAYQLVANNEKVIVIYISFEQSKEALRIKILSQLSRVDSRSIHRGKNSTDTEAWGRVQKAAAELYAVADRLYFLEANQTFTVERIKLIVEALMAKHGTKTCVLVVDYLQKVPVADSASRASKRDEIGFLCTSFAQLSRDLQIAIIAISSEARSAYNRTGLTIFRESGEIEFSIDTAVALHVDKDRTESNKASKALSEARAVDLYIPKNRDGELAKIQTNFYPRFALFKEIKKEALDYHEGLGEGAKS